MQGGIMERVIVIKPGLANDPEVVEVEKLDLQTMQALVEGYIELINLDSNRDRAIDLIVNEEAGLSGRPPLPLNVLVRRGLNHVEIRGTVFICRRENSESVGLTDEDIDTWIRVANSWLKAIY